MAVRTINIYAKEKTNVETVVKNGIEVKKENKFYIYSSSMPSKVNPKEMIYFDVVATGQCDKKLPPYNAEIEFDVSKSYFISKKKTYNKNGKDIEVVRHTLFLDDFNIIKEIPKKITTDEDLPF